MKRVIKAATEFDFESYGINPRKFNDDQLYAIRKGLKSGIDVSQYADPRFDYAQMEEIREGLEDGFDVSWYADPKFDSDQMNAIRIGLICGVDVSAYADPKFKDSQMHQIRRGLEYDVDVSWYADPKFTTYQMFEIREGLESGVDVSVYADPKFDHHQMFEIRKGLESGIDVSQYADPKFDHEQMEQIRKSLDKRPDVSSEPEPEPEQLSWNAPVSIQEYYPWQESEFYAEASDEDLIEHCEENGIGFFETLGEACQAYHDNNSDVDDVLSSIDRDYGNDTTPIPLRSCGDWKDQQDVYLEWLSEFYPEEYKAYSRNA